jgi:diacylglycerol O-acyltransferase / wax synthase
MPITDGMGLVFSVTSHDGRVVISPTSCRELVPEPELLAQCIRDEFQDLLKLARRVRRSRKAAKKVKSARKPVRRKPAPGKTSRKAGKGRVARRKRT